MLKRFLAALRGKPAAAEPAAEQTAPPAAALPGDDEPVVAHDASGREIRITRGQWRDQVLLPNLRQQWDNADELYRLVISGVNDGFGAALLPAAERLVEIDTLPERSRVTHGIVLLQCGQLDVAESTLRAGMAAVGETGVLLTNLAKVQYERGAEEQGEATLWRAVQADPNQDNATMWWATIQRERGGDAAYLEALRKAAALPGSWRPHLWLARHHLEQGDVEAARAVYAGLLAQGTYDASALTMMSGDLGSNGQIPLIAELIAPVYDVATHDPMTGLNLLRTWQALGDVDAGERLLAQLRALEIPPLIPHLEQFGAAFAAMRK